MALSIFKRRYYTPHIVDMGDGIDVKLPYELVDNYKPKISTRDV